MDSTMYLWIALGILVLAIIIAGIGAFLFMKGMKEPMKKIKGSTNNLKERMDKLNLEASSLKHTTSELSEEIAVKSEKVSVLTDAINGTKNSLIDLNASVRSVTDNIINRSEQKRENRLQVQQFTNTADSIIHLPENLQTLHPDESTEEYGTLHFGKVR